MIDGNTLIRFIFLACIKNLSKFSSKSFISFEFISACFLFSPSDIRYPPLKTENILK